MSKQAANQLSPLQKPLSTFDAQIYRLRAEAEALSSLWTALQQGSRESCDRSKSTLPERKQCAFILMRMHGTKSCKGKCEGQEEVGRIRRMSYPFRTYNFHTKKCIWRLSQTLRTCGNFEA